MEVVGEWGGGEIIYLSILMFQNCEGQSHNTVSILLPLLLIAFI